MLYWGTLKTFTAATYLADVQVRGSLEAWLTSIPVSTAILPAQLVAGRNCIVAIPDEQNQIDAQVVAVTTADPPAAAADMLPAHKTRHQDAGDDEISVVGLSGLLADPQTPIAHALVSAYHTAAGLTAGHVLRASSATAFGFAALQDADIPSSIARDSEVTADIATHAALTDVHHAQSHTHASHTGIATDDHHAKSHSHTVADGSGAIASDQQGTFSSATFPPLLGERTSTATNTLLGAIAAQHTTTDDMIDGFGTGYWFRIRDSAGVNNIIANLSAVRSGADNSGRLILMPYSAGSQVQAMHIYPSGGVWVGTTPVDSGSNNLGVQGAYYRGANQVVGARGAAVADADGTLASATSQLNALLARVRTHGLIAT